jgi:hypothetical protein
MGEKARERASLEFSHETMTDRVVDLYCSLLREH